MADTFEEQYLDVLQNIEFPIVEVYRTHPDLTDWNPEKVIEGLIRGYQAEVKGRAAPAMKLSDLEQELRQRVKAMCEWRLGRETMVMVEGEEGPGEEIMPSPITLDEVVACLKRIRLSIKRWNKQGGRRGYLDFVNALFP
jgi:hypothetical protein